MKKIFLLLVLIGASILGYFIYQRISHQYERGLTSKPPTPSLSVALSPAMPYAPPIAQFRERITKKPFGIYITPENSPVSPERFRGYHTAIDVEFGDTEEDVPVYAITSGQVTLSRIASGYGGVVILESETDGQKRSILYGHLRPSALPEVGKVFEKGDQIGLLGAGFTPETDSERKHLHFAVLADNRIDITGYVQTQAELSGWIDPLTLY